MTRKRNKIGILGGTFNPVHFGHLLVAQDALEQAGLDCVRFIPCASPPHKRVDNLAPPARRLAMLKLAIRGDDRFAVDDREIKRGGRSYSVDTLAELREHEPGADFCFIIGTDSLPELHLWKDIERLARMCAFIAVTRPGFETRSVARSHLDPATRRRLRVEFVRGHACDIASREVRDRVARGQSIRYLVPDAVLRYIAAHKLYR